MQAMRITTVAIAIEERDRGNGLAVILRPGADADPRQGRACQALVPEFAPRNACRILLAEHFQHRFGGAECEVGPEPADHHQGVVLAIGQPGVRALVPARPR